MANLTANNAFLIEAAELAARLRDDLLVVDTRKPDAYAQGHIPGALNFSMYDLFATDTRPAGLAVFAQDMAARCLAAGISGTRPVVFYEDETGMRAARDAWTLQYLGHPDVRMLHGGLSQWQAGGGVTTQQPGEDWTVVFRPVPQAGLVIGVDEIAERLDTADLVLLDVRDSDEHHGRDHTGCCVRRGRVPGSTWIEWTEFLDGGRFKSPAAIRKLLADRGIDEHAEIAPYCHRGARSAAVYYALRYAGFPGVRNYIGSWHEWSARSDLPLEI